MVFARVIISACLFVLVPLTARAVQPDEILTDPRLEARRAALSAELRCMVCQNESIDEFECRSRTRFAAAGARTAAGRR